MSSVFSSLTGGAITGVGSLSGGWKVGGSGVDGRRVGAAGGALSSVKMWDVVVGVSFVLFVPGSDLELIIGMRAP